MLDKARTRMRDTGSKKIANDSADIVEGAGLIRAVENGEEVVKVPGSSPDNDDVFVGIAFSKAEPPTTGVIVHEKHENVGSSITLRREPTGSGVVRAEQVASDGTRTHRQVHSGSPNSGTLQLSGKTINFHADDDAVDYEFTYRYSLTAEEAQALAGDGSAGVSPSGGTGRVDYCHQGEIYTDHYETQDNWATGTIKVGANGRLSSGGTGADVTGGRVIHQPSSDLPYIGIYFAS